METGTELKPEDIKPIEPHMLCITFNYGCTIVVPYQEGLQIMSALSKAEIYEDPYGKPPRVISDINSKLSIKILSRDQYYLAKIQTLLGE